jgi:hypothetical protein
MVKVTVPDHLGQAIEDRNPHFQMLQVISDVLSLSKLDLVSSQRQTSPQLLKQHIRPFLGE